MDAAGANMAVMQGGYWVAAEGKQRVPGGGIAGASGAVTPAGILHAVDPATDLVPCGESLHALVPFRELAWDLLRTGVRCHDCVREIGSPS
jgi:hypothetical protein